MPVDFQRVMDTLTKDFLQAHILIDDNWIVSKGTKIEHISLVEKTLKKINVANASLKLRKFQLAKSSCQWLGHHISNNGVTPLIRKTKAIDEWNAAQTRRELKSLLDSLHTLQDFLPNLAELSTPLRPLLNQNNGLINAKRRSTT